ncbi:hypothetical protein BC629DRAFT_1065912 [Irpex lacteus]|nr:hypothetical protein BC629DRAFT_1065912 [Irpex lacteus]
MLSSMDTAQQEQIHGLTTTYYEGLPELGEDHHRIRQLPPKALVELPPEVMSHILSYVNIPIYHREASNPLLRPSRGENEPSAYRTLEACALVCTHWANYFRPFLLEYRLSIISSINQMRYVKAMVCWEGTERIHSLRAHATENRLYVRLVINIHEQDRPTSLWFHHLGLLNINTRECQLHIRTQTDPWNIPFFDWQAFTFLPKTVLPSTFRPFTQLTLQCARIPSLETLLRFLRQFSRVRRFRISWIQFGRLPQHIIAYPSTSTKHLQC